MKSLEDIYLESLQSGDGDIFGLIINLKIIDIGSFKLRYENIRYTPENFKGRWSIQYPSTIKNFITFWSNIGDNKIFFNTATNALKNQCENRRTSELRLRLENIGQTNASFENETFLYERMFGVMMQEHGYFSDMTLFFPAGVDLASDSAVRNFLHRKPVLSPFTKYQKKNK